MKHRLPFALTLILTLHGLTGPAEAAPAISNVTSTPSVPSDSDSPWINATVTPANGRTISQVQLTYSTGSQGATPVFTETLGTTAVKPWTGATGSDQPWTVTGSSYFELRTGANYVTSSTDCGMEYKGSGTTNYPLTSAMVATNGINAAGNSGYVEFYIKTITLDGTDGWTFQTSTDGGTNWNTRLSELTGSNHAFQKYHYDLASGELVNGLKLRFQFTGGGPADADDKIDLDQIIVSVTLGGSIRMYDDGAHGDGAAGDQVYGAQIPAQVSGTTVNYTITATDSSAGTATVTGSYTTGPAPVITTASNLPGANLASDYSQILAASGGTGPSFTWSVAAGSTLPPGLTLSSAGILSGRLSTPGVYNFSAKVTDSAGRIAAKAFSLTSSPNILVVVTDDQGWGDVGYHTPPGQVQIQTPTMDSFATQGIRLERFYATTVCSVTRSALLTGRQTIRTGVNNTRGLDLSEHIMPQTFKAAGYQTYVVGKWHLGGSDKNLSYTTVNGRSVRIIQEGLEYAPFNRGWDSHYGQYSGAIDYFTHNSAETDNPDHPDWWLNGLQQDGPSEHTDSQGHGGWSPDLEADKAISHIQNRDPSKPMLLYLAFNSIHGPVSAPPSLISKYQGLGVTDPNRTLIDAAVDGMDAAFGRVLAALDTAGISNNTVVIWFGDNGGDETKGSLNDPLRGDKGDSYDGGLHEVAGIRWPGVLPAGVVSNQYVWVGDIFPTICAAAGVTPQGSKPLDGVNLWPALLAASNSTTVSRGSPLVTDQANPIAIYSFTDPVNGGTKDFKLIRNHVGLTFVNELFNLTDDPYETTDLLLGPNAASYASIVTSLTSAITSITPETYKPYIGPPLITNTVAQGTSVTLYAPFTSYIRTPTVQWRKNGTAISGATSFTQVTDTLGASVVGAYTTTLTLSNVSPSNAAVYDVVVSSSAGSTTSEPGTLSVILGAPILAAPPAFTKGTSITLTWPAVLTATGYTVERSATSDFATVLSTQTSSTPTVTFTGLTSGSTSYYRATATDGTTTSSVSNVVFSTQDAGNPDITITEPNNGATTTVSTVSVQGTATDDLSGVASVVVNGVAANTSDNYAHWSASVPLIAGSNTLTATVTDNAQSGGNTGTASITMTLNPTAPVITSVTMGPTSPTYIDPVWVTARVQPGQGATLSQVQLSYDLGTQVSTPVFQETGAITNSNNWNGTGAINAWTTAGGSNVRQAVGVSNHTAPFPIANCATTSGSPTVTCTSTAGLWPGMVITGTNLPANTKVAGTPAPTGTTFALTNNATGTGSGLSLTACGATLTNCSTTAGSTTVTCDNTVGLIAGMSLSGTGLASNATVSSITNGTTFVMNSNPTTPGTELTITASGAAAEFNGGTANLTDSMFATTNVINTTGNAGYVEFWVQTRDLAATNNNQWTFQVAPDGNLANPTYVTRISEDWNSETVNLTNCVLNAAGAAAGSTTVTCASTTGLTTGRSLSGPNVYLTCGLTSGQSTVNCTNTSSLIPGMFLEGIGIPNNTRIGTIIANTSFTMVTGTTATLVNATATNASAAVAATYFPATATVSSITNGTTFVLNTAAYANTSAATLNVSAAPIAVSATTVNHGYQLFHYDLAANERTPNMKMRWQFAGYTPDSPTAKPRVDIDDIVVATSAPPPTVTLAMLDDGLHGDGAAGDGFYGAQIPVLAGNTTVNFRISATDTNNTTTTNPPSGGYTFTVNSALTDGTIKSAEFLGMPTDTSVTLNVVATSDQYACVEYGTTPGSYTAATPVTLFSVDATKPEFYNPIEIPISGLQPDTEYYYRFRHRDTTAAAFKARGERSFHTARPRGSSVVFTVTADPHLDVNTDKPLFNRTMANITADAPDLHIDLGDIFMTDKLADGVTGVPAQYGGGVFPNQSRLNDRALMLRALFEQACHSIPFFYILGNHEAEYGYLFNAASDKQNNIPAWDLKARKAYFPTPVPDSFYTGNATPKDYAGGTLGLLEDFYAWEWGDALFIVLDPFWNTTTNPTQSGQSGDAWNWSLGRSQYDWLKQTLQNSSARYKFVFMHHIIGGSTTLADGTTANFAARGGVEVADKYEWGGKNADGSEGFDAHRPGWGVPVHQMLVQNKVNVVFHGHDHLYGYQTLDGIVYLECPQPGTANYVTLGSAGDGKYTTGVLLPNSGHIRVTVNPNQALAEYVRAYRPEDENATRHNRDISHSFTMAPRLSSNADLSGLALSAGTLSPAFASGTTSYTASVPNGTISLTVTPALSDNTASVKVNNVTVASGSASGPVSLNEGANTVTVLVTAQDNTPKSYTVVVTRQSPDETWRQTWFGTTANSGDAADTADPYHTGLKNLVVFAFLGPNQNPATARPGQLPQPQLSGGNYSVTFTQPSGVSGIIYGAEWSTDLQNWTPVPDTGTGNQHVFSVPTSSQTKGFIRLVVTAP